MNHYMLWFEVVTLLVTLCYSSENKISRKSFRIYGLGAVFGAVTFL